MRTKPQRPVDNTNHGLSRGLRVDIPFMERGGTTLRDIICKTPLTISSGINWVKGAVGNGVDFASSSSDISNTNIPTYQINTSKLLTIEVIFTRDSGGTGNSYGVLCGMANGTAFGNRIWLIENDNGSGGWGVVFQTWYGTQPGIWSVAYPTVGALQHWFITYDGSSASNDPVFWINGVKTTPTERLTPSGSYRTGGNHLHLGANCELGNSTWDGQLYLARVWDRILTASELQALYADPLRLYKKNPAIYGKAQAVAPSSFRPMVMFY